MGFDHFSIACAVAILSTTAWTQTTTRVSVDSGGSQGNSLSYDPSMSADGRYVAFSSYANNLVPGDTNGSEDVFVHDRQGGATIRVSIDPYGAQGNSLSTSPSISSDGRYVAFHSFATNLTPGDSNGDYNVFVHDLQSGVTTRVSVDSGGGEGNGFSGGPSISSDGRYVTFYSFATNLVPGDTNGTVDVLVHDIMSGATARVSVDSSGVQCNGASYDPSISGDGRYVAFVSGASNLVSGDTNGTEDIFVRDVQSSATMRVSVNSTGAQGNAHSSAPSISSDGRYLSFYSDASNLVPGDMNGVRDVFVHDHQSGAATRVSVDSSGVEGDYDSTFSSISSDGHYVAFCSIATNLVIGDTNGLPDVFVRDLRIGTTTRVSVDSGGTQTNGDSRGTPSVTARGRYVAFSSMATNLVPGDTNEAEDVFVRDRGPTWTITPFCFGDGTGNPCPCGNTGLAGHGCDNSTSTGGAQLAGSGDALLSSDSLQLTSSGERPISFSLFWQGGTEIVPRVFGDGVGCMGAPLKRMFFHNAVGGTVMAPQGVDLPISARSAALGDPISPGTIRVYHVFYRDPDPNFCPSPFGSTFNTTNGLRVRWAG